jgi:2-oxo-4-hydroxy-4-carboxy-5-ureidoimidazoline decarboxylase
MPYDLAAINQMSQAEFVQAFGAIFEQTPTIAAQAWHQRPFATIDDLHQKMMAVVARFDRAQQLALIRAHPDLGSKAKMAESSVAEQSSVGLDCLNPIEYDRFHQLNQAYQAKFGFPFIIAVKNHTKATILLKFDQRLQNKLDFERARAIEEIVLIARFRLIAAVQDLS